jgi:beta-mannanase
MPTTSKGRHFQSARRMAAKGHRAIALSIAFSVTIAAALAEEHSSLKYGVYDPEGRFGHSNGIGLEHIFVPWEPSDVAGLRQASDYAAKRNRSLMVTIEPWLVPGRNRQTLFTDITGGTYDADIDKVASALSALDRALFVRWGHEMEDPTGRYPWASLDANGYIQAYRYFVDRCRPWSQGRFSFVWSPKGNRGMSAYYPGAKYVDFVGVSVYGFEKWDIDHYGKSRDFNARFREIYSVASRYNKPVMIAELGVVGDDAYRRLWFSQVAVARNTFPLLQIAVYFNAKDPEPWPQGYGKPDWRIYPIDLAQGR